MNETQSVFSELPSGLIVPTNHHSISSYLHPVPPLNQEATAARLSHRFAFSNHLVKVTFFLFFKIEFGLKLRKTHDFMTVAVLVVFDNFMADIDVLFCFLP